MSTLQEIEAAAAELPAEACSELDTWLNESEDGWKRRCDDFRREIQIGLDEIERGEVAPLDMAAIKAQARERREARQRGDEEHDS
jgi:hypothetical protein